MKKLIIFSMLLFPLLGYSQVEGDKMTLNFAEKMPEFPGGVEKLYQFISKNVVYPENLRKEKISAKVIATFIIDEDGSIRDIEIKNNVPKEFADETIRVIKLMPRWSPGRQNGKPVIVKYTLPIRFQIN